MKLMITFLAIVFCYANTDAQSKLSVEGVLLNDENGVPIAYANIGIFNESVGTISNTDGSFQIYLDERFLDEKITFSALGFARRSILVSTLVENDFTTIRLKEDAIFLREITIGEGLDGINHIKEVKLGNYSNSTGTMRLDTAKAGGAMALLIEHDEVPFLITKAKLKIWSNELPSFKIRVRLYDVHPETGMPNQDILYQSVIKESSQKRGWVTFDLEDQNIWVDKTEFFIVFEWIMDTEDRKILTNQLMEHLEIQPESIHKKTIEVAGQQIEENRIAGFTGGIWFGTTFNTKQREMMKSYYRLHSLGDWKTSAAILTAGVSVVN